MLAMLLATPPVTGSRASVVAVHKMVLLLLFLMTHIVQAEGEAKSDDGFAGGQCDKLPFDRVAVSNKIKQLLEDMHSKCSLISDLLKIKQGISLVPGSMANSIQRPAIGSTIRQDKLYGRSTIFNETIKGMTSATWHETCQFFL